MQALILAAGYATRLYPLTQKVAKPLLPLGGKPLIDHLVERIAEVADVERIHVVSNDRFYQSFLDWAAQHPLRDKIAVYNDGTFENADRLGAIGDAEYVIRSAGIDDDLLIVAGDNLFEFDLRDLRRFQCEHGSACVTYHFPDKSLIPKYSTVEVDGGHRVVKFTEKPPEPTTDLIGICCYLLNREDVARVREYLQVGNNPDAPGYFMQWLYKQVPLYAYEFEGMWFDIGDLESLKEADNLLRERAGMPRREQYEL